MENMVAHNAIIANKQVVDIGHLDIYSILSLLVLKHSQNMGCHQCDIINRLPHCCVLLSAGEAPDHPREILHQIRRPDCGTAKGILYSHSPAIKTEKNCLNNFILQNARIPVQPTLSQFVQGFSFSKTVPYRING